MNTYQPTPEELANRCFDVEDAEGKTIGYWRDEALAKQIAERVGGEARELLPTDRIACEDDPTIN